MSFFDFTDPTQSGPLLGLLSGLGQAAMPSRLPVPFASVLGKAAGGLAEGQQLGQQYQKNTQEIKNLTTQGKLQEAQTGLTQQNLGQTTARNNALNALFTNPQGQPPPGFSSWDQAKAFALSNPDAYFQRTTTPQLQTVAPESLGLPKDTPGLFQKDPLSGKVTFSNPSGTLSPEAEAQQIKLKQTPGAPEAPLSPERFKQQEQLVKDQENAAIARMQAQYGMFLGPQGAGATGAGNNQPEDVTKSPLYPTAKAVANYQMDAKTAQAGLYRVPGAAIALKNMVMQLNPNYREQDFAASNAAQKAFATGRQGDTVRSMNVAIQHLNVMQQLADAMNNGDVQAINAAKNFFKTQFGSEAPTDFNIGKGIVGDEVTKAIIGSRGGVSDRQENQNNLSKASSWEQLSGAIRTYKQFMAGQLNGLKRQYETTTKATNFNDFLDPATVKELGAAPSSPSASTALPQIDLSPSNLSAAALKAGMTVDALKQQLRAKGYQVP